jgi:hypothetical protein
MKIISALKIKSFTPVFFPTLGLTLLALLLLTFGASLGYADTWTWTGGDVTSQLFWSSASNWKSTTLPGTVPASKATTIIIFPFNSTQLSPNQDIVDPFLLNQLIFDSTATNTYNLVSLTGKSLQFTGSAPAIMQQSNQLHIVSETIQLTENTILSATGTGKVSLQGAISETAPNAGSLTINSGNFSLFTMNTYKGGTTLNAGNLYLNSGGSLGLGAATFNGGTVWLNQSVTINNSVNVTVAGNTTFDQVNAGGAQTLEFAEPMTLMNGPQLTLNSTVQVDGAFSDDGKGMTLASTGANGITRMTISFGSAYTGPTEIKKNATLFLQKPNGNAGSGQMGTPQNPIGAVTINGGKFKGGNGAIAYLSPLVDGRTIHHQADQWQQYDSQPIRTGQFSYIWIVI